MIELSVPSRSLAHIGTSIKFATYYRLYTFVFTLLVQSVSAVHIAVVSDRDRGHIFFNEGIYERRFLASRESSRSVEKTVFRMHVQMHERLFLIFVIHLLIRIFVSHVCPPS